MTIITTEPLCSTFNKKAKSKREAQLKINQAKSNIEERMQLMQELGLTENNIVAFNGVNTSIITHIIEDI
ncbi:hypothetical protein Sps_04768 [Shewanella psychrophila]|uniref:Uncharacterized protein n=1 Tax=Shewanella psychrophila TaxID=225848 RepID=A0A1S6HWH3_9GAMM|nr:hypothetical protein [Shewanella psychrophila]AQS39851.1 hypothetical protein Sps_04768 [Shewanella psychrophila]